MEFLGCLIMQSGVDMACSFSFLPSVNVSVLFFKKQVFLFFYTLLLQDNQNTLIFVA